MARHFNIRVSAAPRIEHENIHLAYVTNGDTKTMPPSEYNLNPDRIFVGNNFPLLFRSLVFPNADVMTSLTLQTSKKPFPDASAASTFCDGATLHLRWRAVTRPYYDADAPTTTRFSSTVRPAPLSPESGAFLLPSPPLSHPGAS